MISRFEMSRFFPAIDFGIGFGKFYGFEMKVLNYASTVFAIKNTLFCHLLGSLFHNLINKLWNRINTRKLMLFFSSSPGFPKFSLEAIFVNAKSSPVSSGYKKENRIWIWFLKNLAALLTIFFFAVIWSYCLDSVKVRKKPLQIMKPMTWKNKRNDKRKFWS